MQCMNHLGFALCCLFWLQLRYSWFLVWWVILDCIQDISENYVMRHWFLFKSSISEDSLFSKIHILDQFYGPLFTPQFSLYGIFNDILCYPEHCNVHRESGFCCFSLMRVDFVFACFVMQCSWLNSEQQLFLMNNSSSLSWDHQLCWGCSMYECLKNQPEMWGSEFGRSSFWSFLLVYLAVIILLVFTFYIFQARNSKNFFHEFPVNPHAMSITPGLSLNVTKTVSF